MKTRNSIITNVPAKSTAIILIALISILGFSCQKYLDVKQSSKLSLISSASDCQLLLNNYNTMNTAYPGDGEAMADNYYLTTVSYNTLSSEDALFYTWSPAAQRSLGNPQWLKNYTVVYYSNIVLEALNRIGLSSMDQNTANDLKGQALFFRANAFYHVAELFCKPYNASTAAQDPGIPLHLSSDVNEKSVRGTVKGTYDQIIGDLQTATNLLASTSLVASRPNKAAAYALLARIYLAMGEYDNAGTAANNCLQLYSTLKDYNTVSKTSTLPFSPRFSNKEIIFQSVMAPANSIVVDNAVITYGGTTNPTIAKVDTTLYREYDSNDLRKAIFFKGNTGTNAGSYKFTGDYEPTTTAAFFDGLATDEIYLIAAECAARAGNTNTAMNDLNTLLRNRYVTGTFTDLTAASADDALNKVLIERRKELLFRGLRWSDLRRLNMDSRFQTTLVRVINGQTYTLPPNDKRYVELIPVDVIANSTIAQNPR